jgi:hypothetical protein
VKRLYALTASLLIVHEIDSAYWREWELFRLPGGIAAFLALHVPLALLVLWGYERVSSGTRAGTRMAVAVGAAGTATAAIHGAFLASGAASFRTAPSLALIAATGLAGLALLAVTVRR